MKDFNPLIALNQQAGELAERVEFVASPKGSLIDNIHLGVLFIMAFWSGPSRQALHHLVKSVTELDLEEKLRIVVADIDGMQNFHEAAHFDAIELSGCGETFWVKEGQVVSKSGPGLNFECVRPNTFALLRESS